MTKSYYKVWQVLQKETKFIKKCDKYYKVWQEFITKCDKYYKMWQFTKWDVASDILKQNNLDKLCYKTLIQ